MTQDLTGHTFVAGSWTPGTGTTFQARSAATGDALGPAFAESGPAQIAAACAAAAEAAAAYRGVPRERRAAFLDAAAAAVDALGDQLTERVVAETALPPPRAGGERARTVGQLRMFAEVVREGAFLGERHDAALPERTPLPRPDLRMVHVPVGPVAVFGASNFPLAFSVAGGDTASALAAGCPVVVKAHPAHPGVSELVARALAGAAADTGMPPGVFSMLHGGAEVGQALVRDPRIRAVGFTGSRAGGLALVEAGRARAVPIPVYAEMSSVNPVVVLPGGLADPPGLAAGYVASLTREAGQYCTNPGLLFLPEGPAGEAFLAAVREATAAVGPAPMLTRTIARAYAEGLGAWRPLPGVRVVAEGSGSGAAAAATAAGAASRDAQDAEAAGAAENEPAPAVFLTDLATFAAEQRLHGEVFGPAGLIVRYPSVDALLPVLAGLEGQLTATVHGGDTDLTEARRLLPVLEDRAGRVLWGGWPTGVEVAPAMVHGGPWPATSAPSTTSVGTLAVARWMRPVCYQNLPAELLPPESQY